MALELQRHAEQGVKTIIISLEGTWEQAQLQWPRLRTLKDDLVFLDKHAGLTPSLVFDLAKVLKHHKVDCVHTHHIGPLIYGGMAARLAGVSHLIHTEHDAWHLDSTKRRMVEKASLAFLRPKLVADASFVANSLKGHSITHPVTVIENGIDVDMFCPGDQLSARKKLFLPTDAKIIGCSARLEEVKGHQYLLKALSMLDKKYHLVLAGSGSLKNELKTLCLELKIEKRVHFLGKVEDMPTFYQALDVFCLPSLNEGMPLSSLEAQACGIPCVLTDVGGCAESICEKSGTLVPARNSKALAKGIILLCNRNSQCNPRDFISSFRNIKHVAQAYAQLSDSFSGADSAANASVNTDTKGKAA